MLHGCAEVRDRLPGARLWNSGHREVHAGFRHPKNRGKCRQVQAVQPLAFGTEPSFGALPKGMMKHKRERNSEMETKFCLPAPKLHKWPRCFIQRHKLSRASPVARQVPVIVPLPSPRRSGVAVSFNLRLPMLPSPMGSRLSLRGFALSRPPLRSLPLRPDDCSLPRETLPTGFGRLVSRHPAIQATGLLNLTPVGRSPAEHASLRWTHYPFCNSPVIMHFVV